MHLRFRNVNDAFYGLVSLFGKGLGAPSDAYRIRREDSRNGRVMVLDEPITVTYERPAERVLFNAARDANPFFHMYEALWMLAGRNDVAPLAYYAKNMRNYSDDGDTLNGAYGYRWRYARIPDGTSGGQVFRNYYGGHGESDYEVDQLEVIVSHLKSEPTSRRAVLQMWNVHDDLLKMHSKDICCNLSVMFSLRENTGPESTPADDFLDMTVINRSNDMIWGMLGANYVHFTFLQEYVAARLGVEVGRYHHFTNNLHAYEWNWEPEEWLRAYETTEGGPVANPYQSLHDFNLAPVPLAAGGGTDPCGPSFMREVWRVTEYYGRDTDCPGMPTETIGSLFLRNVAVPVLGSYAAYKAGVSLEGAWRSHIMAIADPAWRVAAGQWLTKRYHRKNQHKA